MIFYTLSGAIQAAHVVGLVANDEAFDGVSSFSLSVICMWCIGVDWAMVWSLYPIMPTRGGIRDKIYPYGGQPHHELIGVPSWE